MVKMCAKLIIMKLATIEDVRKEIREEVIAALNQQGYDINGESLN